IVIPPAIFFYYSTLFDSRFKTLQQNRTLQVLVQIRDLLLDNNNLLKNINSSVQQVSNENYNEQIEQIKRNSGLQKRSK
ncbi:hypothetical protein, partial [Lactococcus lactis]|uniref:hypothetical protein n=1 Tax=Lactococcus lactis TaxID=1358 RepID=UPI003D0A93D3